MLKPVSMTYFVDFISQSGPPKLTIVKKVRKQEQDRYDPRTDFWKTLREGIINFHKSGGTEKSILDEVISRTIDPERKKSYQGMIKSYKKFLGKKELTWFDPPKCEWKYGDLSVRVNPELGLVIDGQKHVIKMNLKSEDKVKLSKPRVSILQSLMGDAIDNPEYFYSILDVPKSPKSKLYAVQSQDIEKELVSLLHGEASSFMTMYKSLGE